MSIRIELLKRYLLEDPSDSFLRYALALEFIALENHLDAYTELSKLLIDDPDYLAAYYITGKSAEELGKKTEALHLYMKGLEVSKAQKNVHTMNELAAAIETLVDDM